MYAYTHELEEWLRGPRTSPNEDANPAAAIPVEVTATADGSSGQAPASERGRTIRKLKWILAGAFVMSVFVAIYSYRQTVRFRARAAIGWPEVPLALQRDGVAVLPFANMRGDVNTDYLSDGITESLISNLTHVPKLKVISRDAAFRYKGKATDIRKVCKDLGIPSVVTGRVMLAGDSVEVNLELTNLHDTRGSWSKHYSSRATDLIALQRQIAADVAKQIRSTLNSDEQEQVTNQGTTDPEAYSSYLQGRYAFHNRSYVRLQTAISLFDQAIAKDPRYALAYAGLADVYSVLPTFGGNPSEDYPKSNAAARRALELDPTLARPHAVLGSNEMGYDWDFAGGEAEFK